jgi:hypothetical protein
MQSVIETFGTKLYEEGKHVGYKVFVKHMIPLWKKWSRNRDPDMERVNEILESRAYIPKFIHLADLEGEGLVCYDGNHRRMVMEKMNDDTQTCIVDVLFGATTDDVYQAFVNINKGVEVPEIYIDDTDNIKEDVTRLVRKYEIKYKSFVSTSSRCRAPHFNRDTFVENITKIYKHLQGCKTVDEIGELLEKLNTEYSRGHICKPHDKYKPLVTDKCQKYGLWLFLEREIPPEHVERLIQRKRFGIF